MAHLLVGLSQARSTNDFSLPDPQPQNDEEREQCQIMLFDLAQKHPPSTILAVAACFPPDARWTSLARQWSDNDAAIEPGDDKITAYIASAIVEETFPTSEWLLSLLVLPKHTPRLIHIRRSWVKLNANVGSDLVVILMKQSFLNCCEQCFDRASSRLLTSKTILDALLSEQYTPGMAVSSTLMARAASHPIMQSLLRSLLFDTGNQLFTVALRIFIVVLPFAPHDLTPHVPLLMVILGRAACWRDRPFVDSKTDHADGKTRTPSPNSSMEWEVATTAMELPLSTTPSTLQPHNIVRLLLVAVYNAWPSNVIAFVRDPVSYINGKGIDPIYDIPWEEVWVQGVLAIRAGPLLRNFHLHPSLVYFNSTGELADENRWERVDPPEFITRSHMLAHSELLSGDRYDLVDGDPWFDQARIAKGIDDSTLQETTLMDPPVVSPITDSDSQEQHLNSELRREIELLRLEARYTDRIRKHYLYRKLISLAVD